jgi:polyhydroxybutyrate depolymerase
MTLNARALRMLACAATVLFLIVLVAMKSQAASGSVTPPAASAAASPGCGKPVTAGTTNNTLLVRGVQRSYVLAVPTGLNPLVSVPLILGFHGGSDTGTNASRYMGLTGTEAAVYVYPQAPYWPEAGGVAWDVSPAGVDFPYVDAVVTALEARFCVDPTRVFATGKSNGAFFVNALACYRPGLLRGIAPVAGGGPQGNCTRAVAATVIHGSADTVVPIDSGRQSRDYWLAANGYAGAAPVPTYPAPCVAYPGTAKPVHWCQHTGGHVWPTWAGEGLRHFFLSFKSKLPA